jgi:hypothetical protein
MMEKDKFAWNKKAKEAFQSLKKAFILAPIFVNANSSKLFGLTNASHSWLFMHPNVHPNRLFDLSIP